MIIILKEGYELINPWDKNCYDNIILYTTNCPKCHILEKKLKEKEIFYEVSYDIHKLIAAGFREAPILEVNKIMMSFGDAVRWVNSEPDRHRPQGGNTTINISDSVQIDDSVVKITDNSAPIPTLQEVLSNGN